VTDVFSPGEVQKLLGLSPARLRSLDRTHIVSPTGSRRGKRAYTFQDLIALRATHDLLESRVKIRDVAKAIGALRTSLPRVTRPLQELRIVSDGQRVVVRAQDGAFEALTGQLVLDFQVNALRQDVVRVLRPNNDGGARTAYDLYTRASALDEDPKTFDEAESALQARIHLDPSLAIAYTNLGNIRFRRGDEEGAEKLYAQALESIPSSPRPTTTSATSRSSVGTPSGAFLTSRRPSPSTRGSPTRTSTWRWRSSSSASVGGRGPTGAGIWSSSPRGPGPTSPVSTCRVGQRKNSSTAATTSPRWLLGQLRVDGQPEGRPRSVLCPGKRLTLVERRERGLRRERARVIAAGSDAAELEVASEKHRDR